MRPRPSELDDLTPDEFERLKKRFDAWREAIQSLEPAARGEEPLFPGDLEDPH